MAGIRVVSAVSFKGGCGKSNALKALASAAVYRGEKVTIIDTDASCSCVNWNKRAADKNLWSDRANVIRTLASDEISSAIDAVYAIPDQDHLVLIDTVGGGTEAQDYVALLSHAIFVPSQLLQSDLDQTLETARWYVGLRKRAADPASVPPFKVLLNRITSKLNTNERAVLTELAGRLPVFTEFMAHRAAYQRMDSDGLLGPIADSIENPVQADLIRVALAEASSLLDEIDQLIETKESD